jgi:integrase
MSNGKMKDGIVQRGKTWAYVIRETDPATGRSRPRWRGGYATRAAAKRARDEARAAVHQGTYVSRQDITVGEWLDQWMGAHAVELKPSTASTYRAKIDLYLKPTIGHERLQSLSPSRLNVVFATMRAEGGRGSKNGRGGAPLSPRTVEFARAVLRRSMNDAIVDRLIQVNPVVGTKRPRPEKTKHTTWTGAQLQVFLTAAAEDRLLPLWTLAAATGMRRGELMGLRWDDVDLEAGIIAIDRSTTQLGKELVTTTPKNHERRHLAIDGQTVDALRAWRRAQVEERMAVGAGWADEVGSLFTWQDGTRVQPDYVTKRFKAVQAVADLPRLTLHELRHTHATILLRDRVPVHIVAKRLGHRDPSVTLDVYADVIPDDDGTAVDVFRKAVWGA